MTKRNEEEIRPSTGELEAFDATELAEVRVTRSQAIKLAGMGGAGFLLTLLWPADADAANRKRRKRRKRRRRRQRAVTSNPSTVTFGDTVVGTPSPAENVTITNDGPGSVTLTPEVVGDGFTIAPTFPGIDGFTLAPGASIEVPIIFTPEVGGVSTGKLRIVDAVDGLLVETVELIGEGILP